MTLEKWLALSAEDRAAFHRGLYQGKVRFDPSFIEDVIDGFRERFSVECSINLADDYGVLGLSIYIPFITDRRGLPGTIFALPIKYRSELPGDFGREFPEYIWAPENYASWVRRHCDRLRRELDLPDASETELLDALLGRSFVEWTAHCITRTQMSTRPLTGMKPPPSKAD